MTPLEGQKGTLDIVRVAVTAVLSPGGSWPTSAAGRLSRHRRLACKCHEPPMASQTSAASGRPSRRLRGISRTMARKRASLPDSALSKAAKFRTSRGRWPRNRKTRQTGARSIRSRSVTCPVCRASPICRFRSRSSRRLSTSAFPTVWPHDAHGFLDGSKKPEALEFWMGDSHGHWEGDTLVVDVTLFTDKTWFDKAGNFHSLDLHVVERYTY